MQNTSDTETIKHNLTASLIRKTSSWTHCEIERKSWKKTTIRFARIYTIKLMEYLINITQMLMVDKVITRKNSGRLKCFESKVHN